VVQRLERRTLCAATPAGFAAAGAPVPSQLVARGDIGAVGDEDWYSLGRLHAGDVLTLSLSGLDSGRGTLPDPWVRLYRAAAGPERPALVASDNDAGTGQDALVLRQLLPADDFYFVRAIGNGGTVGTYELSAWLEAAHVPGGGAGAVTEAEPDGDAAAAQDVSAAWAAARYVSSRDVSLAAGEVNDEALALRAGDVVSVVADSAAALDAGASLEDEGGVPLAIDRGDSDRRIGDVKDAYLFAVCLPKDAVYHVKTWGNGGTAGVCRVQVYLSREVAEVVGRQVFYNDSAYDGHSAGAGPEDDAAVAPDKAALRPGAAATLANVTNFASGLNGIFVDVKGLRRELTGDDFEFAMSGAGGVEPWVAAPQPVSISRRQGAGVNGSDRVALVWPDGSVVNRWLRVTVKATEDNDFPTDDVFYFGNLVGETGDDPGGATVTTADVLGTRAHQSRPTSLTDRFDFNRDGRVNALDQAIARADFSGKLVMFNADPLPAPALNDATVSAVPLRRPVMRRLRYEPATSFIA
jgi:hypothetical protein